MRYLPAVLRASGLAGALALAFASNAVAETNLRIASIFANGHSSTLAMEKFAEEIKRVSNGNVSADIFAAAQLGGASENVDQVVSGAIFGTWLGAAYLSRTVPELEAISLPFLGANREAAFKLVDGKIGDLLAEKLAAKGFTVLGYMELGARQVTNNVRPITKLEDFKGLKIRLQPNETHLATFRALGANPVAMGWTEVFPALQQGVLDGQENPYGIMEVNNIEEVTKYLSNSEHFFDLIVLVASKARFDALTAEEQASVKEAAAVAVAWQRSKAQAEDDAAKQALIAAGMQYDPIPDAERQRMIDATQSVVVDLRKRIGDEIIDAVVSEVAR